MTKVVLTFRYNVKVRAFNQITTGQEATDFIFCSCKACLENIEFKKNLYELLTFKFIRLNLAYDTVKHSCLLIFNNFIIHVI